MATPDTSAHVSGDAVDIGPVGGQRRGCPQHGAAYGLCQIYDNEPWHYELRPRGRRPGLPGHVRRPDARSTDAALTRAGYNTTGCRLIGRSCADAKLS